MSGVSKCDECYNYVYDDELGMNVCEAQMDMDEVESIASMGSAACPYYRVNNEYKLVEKQN